MPFGCCYFVFKGHNVPSKQQAHWKPIYKMSQSSNSELLSGVGRSISSRVFNSTKLLTIFPSPFPDRSFLSFLFHLSKRGHKPLGLITSLWNINQKLYAFAHAKAPWCFINLISKCFKQKLADPCVLPSSCAQRCPGHINLFRNTRRHVPFFSPLNLNIAWISASINK